MPIYHWDDVEIEEQERARLRPITGTSVQVVRGELKAHSVFDVHSHPHEQLMVLVEGRIRVEIDGVISEAGPGDVVHFLPGVTHGVTVLDENVVTLDIFSPPRTSLNHDDPR